MVQLAIQEQILDDLNRLSPAQQRQATDFVHGLVSSLASGTAGRDLLRFSGTLDDESTREMTEAIKAGCEQVDLDEW